MPKANITSVPISALFALNKPSGPTSMSVINDVKKLVASSRLFVPESVLAKQSTQKKGKGKRGSDAVKIGQGGTLDPLADGVLGMTSTELLVWRVAVSLLKSHLFAY